MIGKYHSSIGNYGSFCFWILCDRFLLENERRMTKEMEKRKPLVVRLSGNMSLEEIDKEIDKFRKDHINFEIILIEKSGMM